MSATQQFKRVLYTPKRGFNKATVEAMSELADAAQYCPSDRQPVCIHASYDGERRGVLAYYTGSDEGKLLHWREFMLMINNYLTVAESYMAADGRTRSSAVPNPSDGIAEHRPPFIPPTLNPKVKECDDLLAEAQKTLDKVQADRDRLSADLEKETQAITNIGNGLPSGVDYGGRTFASDEDRIDFHRDIARSIKENIEGLDNKIREINEFRDKVRQRRAAYV